ncbi:SDR family NAD(P)-dependent oxidoreductase [Parafilimonas sp.]|uniref:SDR family NAD(P)-dependent oxidoreductase n=1 Tax=Parafilimonas sp. TaxID=1969739 RepID=UPI0039E54B1C
MHPLQENIHHSSSSENTARSVFSLRGKTALVTGGGSGLGLAIAKALASNGAKVIIAGRDESKLQKACSEIGNGCSCISIDLSSLSAIPAFVEQLIQHSNTIDILVNNAGINMKKEALEVTDEEFQNIILTNQQAVFALTREVARQMAAVQQGSIIMISSMAAHYGLPKVIAYTASKTAIEGMTRALAVELAEKGIRVNCIAPGFIATDMSAKALSSDPDRMNRVLARTPMKKLGHPDDIGYAAAFLASEGARFITGAVLAVDGGNSIGF